MAEQEEHDLKIKIVERCQVSPSLNSVPTSSLSLSYLDIPWMLGSFIQHVLFFEFPDDLAQTIIPALRSSLSIALQNFYPLAAKIMVPPLPGKPQIVYNEGDSVPFTVAESTADFHELNSNDPQDVKLLHPLVPQLSPWSISEEGICTISPLIAIQVTLFRNSGLCLGVRYNHAVCDGMGYKHFMKSWTSICRTGDVQNLSLPFLDRGIIEDPNDLQTAFLKVWWDLVFRDPNCATPALCHVTDQRATFILSRAAIDRLKTWILNRSKVLCLEPMIEYISSFAAVCAFTWVCLVKSTSISEDQDDGDKPQLRHFGMPADCRGRLEIPLLDETYFGNCIVSRLVPMEKNVLLGRDGTVLAAMAIARKVKELEDGDVLKGVERFISDWFDANQFGVPLTVAWSPRLAVYDTDFGWGRPKKSAMVHIDITGAISLAECRDEEGGMEIGVVLRKASMDAFTSLFNRPDSFVI